MEKAGGDIFQTLERAVGKSKVRLVPDCYGLPRRSILRTIASYSFLTVAGIGTGLFVEGWIMQQVESYLPFECGSAHGDDGIRLGVQDGAPNQSPRGFLDSYGSSMAVQPKQQQLADNNWCGWRHQIRTEELRNEMLPVDPWNACCEEGQILLPHQLPCLGPHAVDVAVPAGDVSHPSRDRRSCRAIAPGDELPLLRKASP